MAEFQDLKSEVQSWNLYTDEKLVSKLDSFLNHMMAQCEIIHKNTEQTLYETNAVSVYLSDTFNALSNLSNKKFIENSMAPLEEPQIVPKEPKQYQEMTVERKQENFQKALKNVIDVFNITSNDDDTEMLTKSNTMSMSTMFKTGDHLPFIIGSKAFNQDEFLGIVDRTDNVDKYLRELNKDALGDDQNSPTATPGQANGQYANTSSSSQPRAASMMIAQPTTNLPPIPGATNRVAINNTTLGPPPPLKQLFEQYEAGMGAKAGGRAGLMDEITSRPPNPMGGRGGLLGEIAARGQDQGPPSRANLLGEIAAAGQDRPPNPMGGRGNLLGEIAAAGQDRQERPPNPMGGRGNLLGEIQARGQDQGPPSRANLLGEIAAAGQDRQERPPNPMGGRGNLLGEIQARGQNPPSRANLLGEIAAAGQERQANPRGNLLGEIQARGEEPAYNPEPPRQKTIQEALNEKFAAQNRGMQPPSRPTQQYGQEDEGFANRRISDIKSNPLYQPIQPQQQRQNKLFDEDDEDDIGHGDMFRSSNANKKKFENLLSGPGPASTLGNPLLGSNPFDPFGLQNPFMPFNPKSAQAQAAAQREEQKKPERDSMMNMSNAMYEDNDNSRSYADNSRSYADTSKREEKETKGNRLTKLFEDSDEDEESRFTKQRLLSQKYRTDVKPKVEEKPAGARVSKMFDDDEEEGGFMSKKAAQPKKEAEKPQPVKSKLADIEEDDDFLSKSTPKVTKKEEPARASKPVKASLFDDDDDDMGSLRASKKPAAKLEPPKVDLGVSKRTQKKGMFDDDDDEVEQKKEAQKPAAKTQKPLQTKKSLFDNDDEEEPQPPKKIAPPEIKPPVVREEPKPVYQEPPKPVIREEPKPVYQEPPKPIVREEPKPEPIQPRTDIRPLAQDVLEIKEDKSGLQESWGGTRSTGPANLTQMIKAAQMAKKKKNSSDESDSDESDSPPPVKKPVVVETPVQPVVQEPPRVIEEPKVQTWQQEEKPVVKEEEPEVFSPVKNNRGGGYSTGDYRKPSEEPEYVAPKVERKDSEESSRTSISKQNSQNISSRISALQNQLNLNMNALKPGEGLPEHMRKAKVSIQREEEPPSQDISLMKDQSYPGTRTQSEAISESGMSHMAALDKPVAKARAKKTITFEDDEEEEVVKKPAMSYNPVPAKVEIPVYEEPRQTVPIAKATSPFDEPRVSQQPKASPFDEPRVSQQPKANPFDEPPAASQRQSTKKKVNFMGDEDEESADPLGGFGGKKPQAAAPTMSSGADDPMSLLKGLSGLGGPQKSSPSKKAKEALRDDDDDDLGLGLPKKQASKPAPVTMSESDPNNPLALLSGLKMMDEGRKSTKSKSKGKSKLFDDDDDAPPVLRPSTKAEEPRASTKQKSKLFNDSDEDQDFLKKKPAGLKPAPATRSSKPRGKLFDDSD